jgi:DNA-binding MarR family transcriptional regulator
MESSHSNETRFAVLNEISLQLSQLEKAWSEEDSRFRQSKNDRTPVNKIEDYDLMVIAERIYKFRRTRERYLPDNLLGEPAWDILLDLFIAYVRGRKIRMTSAAIAGAVPSTTAHRWITVLESEGLIERYSAKEDRRATNVQLTKQGLEMVRHCLIEMVS